MRVLRSVVAEREQLPIVANDRAGIAVVRGAAGSGKTTTALLRLRQLCAVRRARRIRENIARPVKVLVLTYNRSLAGYVGTMAQEQVQAGADLHLTVSTFGKWASVNLNLDGLLVDTRQEKPLTDFVSSLPTTLALSKEFLVEEIDYAFGRFAAVGIDEYVRRDRDGRGLMPRVDKQKMLAEILRPYRDGKPGFDWNDVAENMAALPNMQYDIIVVDEAQDFSANQVRAVLAHLAPDGSLTFVLDTVQRIYPRFFTWREVRLDANQFVVNGTLSANRRNTAEIAAFARPLVAGLTFDENGQLPDLTSASRSGPRPVVFGGSFDGQVSRMLQRIRQIDLSQESVGILHPLGHGWFRYLKSRLTQSGVDYVELSQKREWPAGPVNVGLSTLHSAKGLEYDHVIICGLTRETLVAGEDEDDDDRLNLRRLLAMGIGRARQSLLLTFDPSMQSTVLRYLDPSTYDAEGAPLG